MAEIGKLKKVRFKRNAHKTLHSLPSHENARGPVHAPILAPRHLIIRRTLIGALAFVGVFVVALLLFVNGGFLQPVLERQARTAFLNALPENYRAELGETDVRLVWPQGIGINFNDIKLFEASETVPFASVDETTLSVSLDSLFEGTPRLSNVQFGSAELVVAGGESTTLPELKLAAADSGFIKLFDQIRNAFGPAMSEGEGIRFSVDALKFLMPQNNYAQTASLDGFEFVARNGIGSFNGVVNVEASPVPIEGTLNLVADGPSRLSLSAQSLPMPWRRLQTIVSNDPTDHTPDAQHAVLLADVTLEFTDTGSSKTNVARVGVMPLNMQFKLGADNFVPVNGGFDLSMDFPANVLRFQPTIWQIGRSSFTLAGGVRDPSFDAKQNAYEFELIANDGSMAPADSPEDPVKFAARASGIGYLKDRQIQFSKLDILSEDGSAFGQGEILLDAEFPTAVFDVRADDFSISGVKQFWPAPVARAARSWVLQNLAGGRVVSGQFDIAEPLRRRIDGSDKELTGDTKVSLDVEGVQFNVVGDIPPVKNADGTVNFANGETTVSLKSGTVFLPSGQTTIARNGVLTIPRANQTTGRIRADLAMDIEGKASAVGELISFDPIGAQQYYPYKSSDLAGEVKGRVNVDFLLNGGVGGADPDWSVDLNVAGAGSAAKIEGRQLDGLDGRIQADSRRADFDLDGNIDGLPADIAMVLPFGNSGVTAKRNIKFQLDTADREGLAPGLETMLTGRTPVGVTGSGDTLRINADLSAAKLSLPWIGWAKGAGVKASAAFNLLQNGNNTSLTDFKLSGSSFGASGTIDADSAGLKRARFGFAQLNASDNVALDVQRNGNGYTVNVSGKSFDGRAPMRHARAQARATSGSTSDVPVDVSANIGRVTGFHGEHLNNVKITMRVRSGTVTLMTMSGMTKSGFPVDVTLEGAGSGRSIKVNTLGAGEFLRFADIYTNVRGGTLDVVLNGAGPQTLSGRARLRDFRVFNEPKLAQLVSSKSANSQSLEEAVNRDIDTREVKFEVASSNLVFKPGRLDITEAVARGPLAGFSIQGMVFDSNNQTRLTGTFLPAYGLNRLFAEIPILGVLLGNGRDRGLIGVTFKLDGSYDDPSVTVNPLSVIAPGIFRQIFEFR